MLNFKDPVKYCGFMIFFTLTSHFGAVSLFPNSVLIRAFSLAILAKILRTKQRLRWPCPYITCVINELYSDILRFTDQRF